MKLATFQPKNTHPRMGVINTEGQIQALVLPVDDGRVIDDLADLIIGGYGGRLSDLIPTSDAPYHLDDVRLLPPLRRINSLRDFYAFEQHVKTANQNRGRDVPPAWYEIPVFYFSNHTALFGLDDAIITPKGCEALDYELEIACVIGKSGRDIAPEDAEDHMLGLMIFNDWSARDVQRHEVSVGLGPAKAKDFASSFGPYLVTLDELKDRHAGRDGVFDLEMIVRVNGEERGRGNFKDIFWSYGEMIARASANVTLHAGDVIGSGTVGTGCLLETTAGKGAWLQVGDVVEMTIDGLGVLRNQVV